MGAKAERAKRTRTGIERSLDERCLVRVTRRLGAARPVDGVVISCGIRWVLLERLSADLDLDGYTALRWKHITKVQPFDPESLPARATASAEARSVLVDTTTTGSLMRSLSQSAPPVGLHSERKVDTSCVIGLVVGVVDKSVHVSGLGAPTVTSESPRVLAFDSITRVGFDGRYLRSLARAAVQPVRPERTHRS